VHLLEAYRDLGYAPGSFPVSEQLGNEELSLPMFAELTAAQIESVCAAIRSLEAWVASR
jgi:dTDP-4-amino-4,6-dideoxygalactose transaminase